MNVAREDRNVYENFEIDTDILYFKVSRLGLVSFHGRNYNIKKSVPSEQLNSYIASGIFVKANANCYVNVRKVIAVEDGMARFDRNSESKLVPVSKWHQSHLRSLLS
ncbi:hypothetical protein [Paenibacillus methanolicus]|uniref:LytTr DNA-binding domain-containing protein n=1 Tax=Paenibacillus methanolicus TaxID=582686 RepID=A0A5S5BVP5_9BACL|nr:hypothetical protein [Paenibacillus methanolicus]TYP71107.1 hypothetical protein BCM02_11056 [Paenibacillus methanolicus]